ncbi:Copper resistance protein D [compost metagenome]
MLEIAVVALRWLQYAGAVVLLGTPLFLLYSFRRGDGVDLTWSRAILTGAGLVVLAGALMALLAQTAVMAGSLAEAVKPASLSFMITGTALGKAMVVRAALALAAVIALLCLRPGKAAWGITLGLGLVVVASFAWTGHGAATENPGGMVHLASDILHSIGAALWLGALAALTILLRRRAGTDDVILHRALHGFAGLGTLAVALLVATGLANSWFLVGPSHVLGLGDSLYGQLLIAKLALFVLMLGLAADNRFRLTPSLRIELERTGHPSAVRRLRRSVVTETVVGIALLAVVALMGTLPPPSAM